MRHLHSYIDVHKLLVDAAKYCRSFGDYAAVEFLLFHAELYADRLICRQCGHKWSL